jgi:Methyltransferase domain
MPSHSRCHIWRPAPDVAGAYLPLLYEFGANDEMRAWAVDYINHHAGRLQWDVEFLTLHYQFSACLNIGAAPYLFEHLLSQAAPAVRISSLDLNVARFPLVAEVLGIEVNQADIEQAAPPIGPFECVVCCEIFEHLRLDIIATMQRIASLISDGGFLYLTMPNGLGLTALRRLIAGQSGPSVIGEWQKLSTIGHMGHVREYSAREIREILAFSGLLVEQLLWRRRSARGGSIRSRLREAVYTGLYRVMPALGDEIVVVARKRIVPH